MRKIKFRAWDSDNEEFLSAVPYIESLLDNPDEPVSHHDIDVEDSLYYYPEYPLGETFNGRIIYEQFTGLKDVKGQDIYEGDIIQLSGAPYKYIIEWQDYRWSINDFGRALPYEYTLQPFTFAVIERAEVIGNIHENEELIKI